MTNEAIITLPMVYITFELHFLQQNWDNIHLDKDVTEAFHLNFSDATFHFETLLLWYGKTL